MAEETQIQSAEEQIHARLQNSMSHLASELAAQGVDLRNVSCAFAVTWKDGVVTVAPSAEPKTKAAKPTD